MPELPEVETIKRGLEKLIIGQTISAVNVIENHTIKFKKRDITDKIAEHQISSINRRGKVMIWNLNNNQSLLFHLKMTGQIIYEGPIKAKKDNAQSRFTGGHPTSSMSANMPDKTTRVIFTFSNGSKVFFNDQRKFGWIKLVPTDQIKMDDFLSKIGPEYFDYNFNFKYLKEKLSTRKTAIKAVLLDQKVIAGIGNIYADESLHLAKIHPARIASSLNDQEIKRLIKSIKNVFLESIELGGTSFSNYLSATGTKGNYLDKARVFRKQGQSCKTCNKKIVKYKLNGRGTHFCPNCQPIEGGK